MTRYFPDGRRFYRADAFHGACRAAVAILAVTALAALLLAPGSHGSPGSGDTGPAVAAGSGMPRIRGITLGMIEDNRWSIRGYGTPGSDWALREIAGLGADWTSITPYATMISRDDVEVIPWFEHSREDLEEEIRVTIRQAHAIGLRVLLIPHVYPWDWSWRGQLNPGGGPSGTPEGWDRWFASYREYLLSWARVAAEEGVEMMSIGVEFKSASWIHRDRFALLADEVRETYGGLLVYSANWDEVEDVGFWSHVDVIGLNAFYPVSEKRRPDPEDMLATSAAFADSLAYLSRIHGKPIVFTEVGFKSYRDTYREPWVWPEDMGDVPPDDAMQALLFDVTFATYWDEEWFGGLFVWKFLADPADDSQEPPFGFSPRLKPAQDVIEGWFRYGPAPGR